MDFTRHFFFFLEIISFYHLIDIIIPALKVSNLRIKVVTRRSTSGKTGIKMQLLG